MPPKNRKDGQTSTTDEKKTEENSTTNLLLEQILFTVNENKSTLAANSKSPWFLISWQEIRNHGDENGGHN